MKIADIAYTASKERSPHEIHTAFSSVFSGPDAVIVMEELIRFVQWTNLNERTDFEQGRKSVLQRIEQLSTQEQ